ncbi:enoyl-[acyl-carrier protein] reductase II [Neobacillus niacini]|uniref:NAD(P)H-dependent flavin oxidoreductase n=1 Tax=Neobacillus niacini TaxID=86668 RepID=UPI00285876E6|nr:nitronate monooxygenase [Neobacillus niacini]MDR7076145.1 enoyl-[acyl-carrier protein] reductase II [Neobacillus niacini]
MNWETRVTNLLGIRYPIIQGGLHFLSYSELASSVSNAGGLGQITAMSLSSPLELKEEIMRMREKTNKPFGVNIAIGSHGRAYEHLLQVVVDEKVPVISITGGNPAPLFKQLEGVDVKKLVLVSSKRQAINAEQLGADAIMVVGQEGGGHIGRDDIGTIVLVPLVVDAVSIPVIASGGIGDGRGLLAALVLGAEGIEMGTRFIATEECIQANQLYKRRIIESEVTDTVVIKRSIGGPARVIKNSWAESILAAEKELPTYENLKNLIGGTANKRYILEGIEAQGFAYAGQIIGRIRKVVPVAQLIEDMILEAERMYTKLS